MILAWLQELRRFTTPRKPPASHRNRLYPEHGQ
nr:MAG TPA: hypothetical protein [Caudoviricetes sp.]